MDISKQLSSIAGVTITSGKPFCCPLPGHDDATPSCSVNDAKGVWYCQGCKRGGGVVDFYAYYTGRNPEDKGELAQCFADLRGRGLIEGGGGRQAVNGESSPTRSEFESAAAKPPQGVIESVNRYYQSQLVEGSAAWQFLLARGMTPAGIRLLGLGYAPRAGLAQLAASCGVAESSLAGAGVVANYGRQGPSHHFNDRLIFPVEHDGRLVGFHSRRLRDEGDGAAKAKYKFSQRIEGGLDKGSLVFGGAAARQLLAGDAAGRLAVVEGNLDAALLLQSGIAAVAVMGSKVSSAMLATIESISSRIDYAFDGDAAGRKATAEVFRHYACSQSGSRGVRFLTLDEGVDPAAYLAAGGRWADVRGSAFSEIILSAAGRVSDDGDLDILSRLADSEFASPEVREGLAGCLPPSPEAEYAYTAHREGDDDDH